MLPRCLRYNHRLLALHLNVQPARRIEKTAALLLLELIPGRHKPAFRVAVTFSRVGVFSLSRRWSRSWVAESRGPSPGPTPVRVAVTCAARWASTRACGVCVWGGGGNTR